MNIQEMLNLTQVKRYPVCFMNREQSVAEHSFNVAIIAQELAQELWDPMLTYEVMTYALMHDMEEVFTGDIPSPFKRKLREQCPEVTGVLGPSTAVSKVVKDIVKMADYLESIYYIKEFGGSRYTTGQILNDIRLQFEKALRNSELPQSVKEKVEWLAERL